jgi:excisionase family DNA binding protein
MQTYGILAREDLDSHPTTLAAYRKWLSQAFDAVKRWLEQELDESDEQFCAAVVNRASKLARRLGAGHIAAPHVEKSSHEHAMALLGRLLAWIKAQKPTGSWTTDSIAKWMKVSPDKVRGWIRSGELKATNVAKPGNKPKYRIDPADFDSFLLRHAAVVAAPLGRRRRRRAA